MSSIIDFFAEHEGDVDARVALRAKDLTSPWNYLKLVGMNGDTVIMSVGKKSTDRIEAYRLAEDQYLYCNDIVDQNVGSVVKLAAWLLVTDAWYFWWD